MNSPADDDWIDAVARGALDGPQGAPGGGSAADADAHADADIDALLAYRDGDATEAEAARIEARLAEDPEARALLRELAQPLPPFVETWARRETRSALGARRRRWIGPAVTVALAAAVALFVFVPRGAPIPDYRIDAVRGVQAPVRGDEPAALGGSVDPESILTIALSPAGAVGETPPVRAFVQTLAGRLAAVDPRMIVVGEGGAMRFEAPVAELFGSDAAAFGQRTLWFAVGGPDAQALGALDGQTVEAARAAVDGVRWLPVALEYGEAAR